jgi:threonine dehydrogenase-like Zn-dependent dehydrogenase
MRALVFKRKKLRFLGDYPVPRLNKNEVLIRVTHAGICNTDIEITKGYMGFEGVPGHEFVGIIERCKQKNLIGIRVVGEINIACGTCIFCRKQMRNHCPNRSVMGILHKNGAFAEYVTLPMSNIHALPDSISDEEAIFIEPLAAAFEITRQIDIMPYERVCVLGDGKLGMLVSQVVSLSGCRPVVVGRHEERLSLLRKWNIKAKHISSFNIREFDIVIDCTGSPKGIETALCIVRPGGRIVIKTTTAKKPVIDMNRVVVNELTLIGSRCGPFSSAIRALDKKEIAVQQLISFRYPLEDGIRALRNASRKNVLKVILVIG